MLVLSTLAQFLQLLRPAGAFLSQPGALSAEPLDPLSLLGRLLFRFSLSRYPLRLLELGLDPGRLGDESGVSGCGLPGLFEKNFFQLIVSELLAGSGCSGFLGGDGINNFYEETRR